uniref:Death domain-containing protein n=2 Tax=Clytia hemisphaerica TaxID=252671 RepID=A0A7M5XDL4_9CNID
MKNIAQKDYLNETTFTSKDFHTSNNVPLLVSMTLATFKESRLPLLVILTKDFFHKIWTDQLKIGIQQMLLGYSSHFCLHIWMDDLDSTEVRKWSTGLLRNDSSFRRVKYQDLQYTTDKELKEQIIALIRDNTDREAKYRNYSVQDQDALNFTDLALKSLSIKSKDTAEGSPPTSITSVPSSSSKKRKKKKNQSANQYLRGAAAFPKAKVPKETTRLRDLSLDQRDRITTLLDVGYGANWKQIGHFYQLTPAEFRVIETAGHAGQRPADCLLRLLLAKMPDLSLQDLKEKCQRILRRDVIEIIDELMGS